MSNILNLFDMSNILNLFEMSNILNLFEMSNILNLHEQLHRVFRFAESLSKDFKMIWS